MSTDWSLKRLARYALEPDEAMTMRAPDQVECEPLATFVAACGLELPRGAPEPEPEGVMTVQLFRAYDLADAAWDEGIASAPPGSELYEAWTRGRPRDERGRLYCCECGAARAAGEPPHCDRCFRWAWARDPASVEWPWAPDERNAWRRASSPYEVVLQARLASRGEPPQRRDTLDAFA
ncbi:MAG: hypothetical protein QOE90_1726 [Thermoplasmata archaeon]|nr:hypothetical protein [Thermoplasmata archaeon]